MGAQPSKWIRQRASEDDEWQCDAVVELRLAELLGELRERKKRSRKTRTVACVEGAVTDPLRTTDVVPDELVAELHGERKEAEAIYVPYLRKAAQSVPVVERINATVGSQSYDMPRVTLPEAASLEELEAMNAQYISYAMLGKGSRKRSPARHAGLAQTP